MIASPIDTRSSLTLDNAQELIDAGASAKHALLNNAAQYSTPDAFARYCHDLLPTSRQPAVAFDPQCASGTLIKPFYGVRVGFELDTRYRKEDDGIARVIGNCVDLWAILDDIAPELKFDCQVANPPFGLLWPVNGKNEDSTAYTHRKLMARCRKEGYGYFIANAKTIERLGLHLHPWTYLWQKWPVGIFPDVNVEIGVIHFHNSDKRMPRKDVVWTHTHLNSDNLESEIARHYRNRYWEADYDYRLGSAAAEAFRQLQVIVDEEAKKRPPFNVYLGRDGLLRTHLSTRQAVKEKLTKEVLLKLARLNKTHPLTSTVDRESRKLLASLVADGTYTVQPEARKAIDDALAAVAGMSAPLLPITDFEAVAHTDESETLTCAKTAHGFTAGKAYPLTTASYDWTQVFTRKKVHFNEESGENYLTDHECKLTGVDRFVRVVDDHGKHHRFMDRPDPKVETDHPESMLFAIFAKPEVKTVAEVHPEKVAKNLKTLKLCEMYADFTFYPGQLDYLSRTATKDYGLLAAATGAGKSLMALSLIQLKAPRRALIIAPQGTMRNADDVDDDEEKTEYQAAQWLSEIQKFAPGIPCFKIFSYEDYARIKHVNHGELPNGIFISYPQAMFINGAKEQCPDSWDDARLLREVNLLMRLKKDIELPPVPPERDVESDRYWTKTVGEEKAGIRCVLLPCLATLIAHEFDMVALDECHLFTNLSAQCTQMLIRMQPRYRFGCSATPVPNIVSNLFSLMGWITTPDWFKGGIRSVAWPYAREELGKFNETFLTVERDLTQERMNKEKNPDWKGKCEKVSPIISSPARLLKILKPTLSYISKKSCRADYTPPKIIDVRVPLGREQAALYAHFLDRSNIEAKHPLVRARKQTAYLRNICADPAGFTHGGPTALSNFNPKTLAMIELICDLTKKGEQVNVICARIGQTSTIARLLNDLGISYSRIDSTVAAELHSHEANKFKRKESQTCLMGIKCAAAHSFGGVQNQIIGSLEYSFGSLEQARGRVDRVTSPPGVTIYCVLIKSSIEELMFDVVSTKGDSAEICLQGRRVPREYRPVDASEILAQSIEGFDATGAVAESECEQRWPDIIAAYKKGTK